MGGNHSISHTTLFYFTVCEPLKVTVSKFVKVSTMVVNSSTTRVIYNKKMLNYTTFNQMMVNSLTTYLIANKIRTLNEKSKYYPTQEKLQIN